MLTLLALVSAGAPAAGCGIGGAFIGAQAGFNCLTIKRLAKDKAIAKDDANKQAKIFADAAKDGTAYDVLDEASHKKAYEDHKTFENDTYFVKVDLTSLNAAQAEDKKAAGSKVVEEIKKAAETADFRKATKVKIVVLYKGAAFVGADLAASEAVTDFTKDDAKTFAKGLVDAEAEAKFTSNNGFAGLHVGYLGRVNPNSLLGGVVEANWVFGQDMKDADNSAIKDTHARFNVGLYLRAMFNLTPNFMAGADLGFSGQEIRVNKGGSTDKESKWFWNPAARVVLGVALTENVLATAHFGGVFPMLKTDHFAGKDVKAKYSNIHGGVGISYAFGC